MKTGTQNTVFCELPVIEQIMSDYWENRWNIDVEDITASQHWYSFISKYCELILDVEESEFIELAKTNKFFMRLLKNSVEGGSKIMYWENHLIELEKNNRFEDFPTALFLLNETESYCNQKIKEYGLIFLNSSNYQSFTEMLFVVNDIHINENRSRSEIVTWSDLKAISTPMNSLILTDNYIMTETSDILNNLIPLLDAIVPDQLEKATFDLMIITQEMPQNDLFKRYSEIQEKIRSILSRPYEINLTLITSKISKNHDRRICNNYMRLESNNSFSYFDKEGHVKKNTTLHIFPSLMVQKGQVLMLNKNMNTLAELKKIVSNARQSKGPTTGIANRLLSSVPK